MSAYDEYAKSMKESGELQKQSQDLSTKAQMDQLAENKKLIEAEKQNAFRGAYVDYAKNINPYGVQSELAYGAGLGGAGKGETAQANYYNTYQNRLGEINTNVTNQLRDIANQETTVRLAGDQAKLNIDTTIGQQLAAAQYEDSIRSEQDAREDKNNAYTRIMNAISAGYNPTDEELAAAGMTRGEADAYTNAYKRSLYAGSGGGGSTKPTYMTSDEYIAAEEYVANAAKELDGLTKASDYLAAMVNRGNSNFTAEEAKALLSRYFKKGLEAEDGSWYLLNDGSYKERKPELTQNGKTYVWDNTQKKYVRKQEG